MRENKFMGWSAFVLFAVAAAIMVLLVFSPVLEKYDILNPQTAMIASGVLALAATVLGFFAFKTSQGKVAAIGGLVLALAVGVLISFTTITRVETSGAQPPQPVVESAEP